MDGVIIRSAKVSDAAGIAKVHVETWQCAYKGQIPNSYLNSLSIEKRAGTWKKQLETPDVGTHTLVAEVDGQIVGWCTVGVSRDGDASQEVGELYGIYILPAHAGKGAGSQLMTKALETLKKEGYKKATLWVLDTNEKTKSWYTRKGWSIEGKTKVDKRDGFDLNETRYSIDLQ